MSSPVYFTNMRASTKENLPKKLRRLIDTAGLGGIDFTDKFVAIKIHFGEPGNLAFLRPNYARVVVDYILERGGRPFLTDCNTLYTGRRKHALEHITAAYENGFSPFSTNCHVIIADGLRGTDEALIPIPGDYVHEAKIGRAIADADIVISLTHAKGHEQAGFGGALKNLGMGCGSRAGKMEMHSAGKPLVKEGKCVGCGLCLEECAHGALTLADGKALIDEDKCVGCGRCLARCVRDAIVARWDASQDELNCKIAEYALAVVQGKPHFHISLAIDISPFCDCHRENDAPLVPDVGMFASFDPIALDAATMDAINRQPVLPGSALDAADEQPHQHEHEHDHFSSMHPGTNWRVQLAHGEKLGLGSRDYQLITI